MVYTCQYSNRIDSLLYQFYTSSYTLNPERIMFALKLKWKLTTVQRQITQRQFTPIDVTLLASGLWPKLSHYAE